MLVDFEQGDELGVEICKGLGVDSSWVRRIILDFNAEGPIIAYLEMYVSDKMLKVDWSKLEGMRVEVLEKSS